MNKNTIWAQSQPSMQPNAHRKNKIKRQAFPRLDKRCIQSQQSK
jgi:hypothetical protein